MAFNKVLRNFDTLITKTLVVFLMVILLGSIGATGSLYSIGIESNKDQSLSISSVLFPTLIEANAMNSSHKNCDSPGVGNAAVDKIFKGNKLRETNPDFDFNATGKKLKVKNNDDSTKDVTVHSPYGKVFQDKTTGKDRKDITVNCHIILMAQKTGNGTHNKFEIQTFTSVRLIPERPTGKPDFVQGGFGDILVKNLHTVNAPDLGLNLTSFKNDELFLDSNNNSQYDLGEFIYSNSTDTTVGLNHVRQFDNYTFFNLGTNVTNGDDDFDKSTLLNFNATVKYDDQNENGLFSANETVYLDFELLGQVNDIDVRLANARFVDNETIDPFQDGERANFPNTLDGIVDFNAFKDCERIGKNGFYNQTIDSCNYNQGYGEQITAGFAAKGMTVMFQNKGPDLGRVLTDFKNDELFLDSNTNLQYDLGEFIYSNSSVTTVGPNHVRQFANYTTLSLGTNVTIGDIDFGKSTLFNFNATVKYDDQNGNGLFSATEPVYLVVKKFKKVSFDDVRLANAGTIVLDGVPFKDGSIVHKKSNFVDLTGKGRGIGNPGEDIELGMEERQFNITETLILEVPLDVNNNVFDVGETVYNDTDTTDNVSDSDTRLANAASQNFTDGTIVAEGDSDEGLDLVAFLDWEKHEDTGDTNNIFNLGETIYNDTDNSGAVSIGDSRLANAASQNFADGTIVAEGDSDVGLDLVAFTTDEKHEDTVVTITNNSAAIFGAVLSSLAGALSFNEIVAEEPATFSTVTQDVLFGDTFGQFVTYTSDITAESCFWALGCITWFQISISITPFVITGLRLAVRVRGYDIPDRAFASDSFDIKTDLEPFDASYDDYLKICTSPKNTLNSGGFFGPDTPFDCTDFASYSMMSIPSVIDLVAKDLKSTFEEASELPPSPRKLQAALDKFLIVAQILFDPLPPLSVDELVTRINDSGLEIKDVDGNQTISDSIQGQEVVLKVGVIIEVDLKLFGKDLGSTDFKIEIDLLGIMEGFLFYNHITESISPTIFKPAFAQPGTAGQKADFLAIWDLLSDYEAMRDNNIVFTSFFTPYGFDEDGTIRTIPFLDGEGIPVLGNPATPYNILYLRGNCVEAWTAGQILQIPAPYGPLPLCTGLYAPGLAEAIVGIKSGIGSKEINAIISTDGDAEEITKKNLFKGCEDTFEKNKDDETSKQISYCAYEDDPETLGTKSSNVTRTINVDNFEANTDKATIKIDDFTFRVQWITVGDLLVNFENPVRGFLPDDMRELKINLFTKAIDFFDIPQHPRVSGLEASEVVVFNYAVDISHPENPLNSPNGTKPLKSINFAGNPELRSNATVTYKNIGNSLDKIHDLTITFPAVNSINTDIPWESIPTPAELNATEFDNLARDESEDLVFAVNPPRHYTTTPSYAVGFYNVTLFASSFNATIHGMPAIDPLGNVRTFSSDTLKINVTQFAAPQLNFTEKITQTLPGGLTKFNAKVSNFGNGNDTIPLTQDFIDSNQAGCDLFDKGPTNTSCPYRAEFTALQNVWTNSTELCDVFWRGVLPCLPVPDPDLNNQVGNPTGDSETQKIRQFGLFPASSRNQNFTIIIPGDWAGIDDTTYQLKGKVVSDADPLESDTKIINHTVIATKESSVRYIGLELQELANQIKEVNDDGTKTKGLGPVNMLAMERLNNRALDLILDGNLDGADKPLSANIKIAGGFKKQLAGLLCDGPAPKCEFFATWDKGIDAIMVDLMAAIANDKTSAPQVLVTNTITEVSPATFTTETTVTLTNATETTVTLTNATETTVTLTNATETTATLTNATETTATLTNATETTATPITPDNLPPIASDDSAQTLSNILIDIDVLSNDNDIDGDSLTIDSTSNGPSNGITTINAGMITYTPNPGFAGADSFDYAISDGNGGQVTATVIITVTSTEEALGDLATEIGGLELSKSSEKSLTQKLNNSIKILTDTNEKNDLNSCNKLDEFVNQVNTQKGKGLSDAEADSLIASADAIKTSIGCP